MNSSHYFKTKEEIVRYGISPNRIYEDDPQCVPISKEEYETAIAELTAETQE